MAQARTGSRTRCPSLSRGARWTRRRGCISCSLPAVARRSASGRRGNGKWERGSGNAERGMRNAERRRSSVPTSAFRVPTSSPRSWWPRRWCSRAATGPASRGSSSYCRPSRPASRSSTGCRTTPRSTSSATCTTTTAGAWRWATSTTTASRTSTSRRTWAPTGST